MSLDDYVEDESVIGEKRFVHIKEDSSGNLVAVGSPSEEPPAPTKGKKIQVVEGISRLPSVPTEEKITVEIVDVDGWTKLAKVTSLNTPSV